jgi:type IX secretion system PorP/SprF family membrane protein
MRYHFILICMVCCLLFPKTAQAQDPSFTQFFANPLYVNPAMAGTASIDDGPAGRATLNYRNQWPGLAGSYRTITGSWDQGFDAVHGGFGAQFVHNSYASGLFTTSELRAMYSLRSKLDEEGDNLLYSGIQLSSASRSIDYSRLKFGDQMVALMSMDTGFQNPPSASSISYINPAIGFLFSNPNYYVGLAVHNLLEPNVSFFNNPDVVLHRRYTVHAGYSFAFNDGDLLVQPQMLFTRQKNLSQMIAAAQLQFNGVEGGLGVRRNMGPGYNSTSIIANIGFRVSNLRMFYGFDVMAAGGRSAVPTSHEISMCLRWETQQENASKSAIIY